MSTEKSDLPPVWLYRTNYDTHVVLEYTVISTKKKYIISNTSDVYANKIEKVLRSKKPNKVFQLLKELDPQEVFD